MPTEPQSLDLPYLQNKCEKLRESLQSYSSREPDAALCLRELTPLFDQVMSGQIFVPRKGAAPCGYYFHEGSLRKYPILEDAYANFSMALQGSDPLQLKALLDKTRTA